MAASRKSMIPIHSFPYPKVTEEHMNSGISSPHGAESGPDSPNEHISQSPSSYSLSTLESGKNSVLQSPIGEDEDAIKVIVR